MKRSMLQHAKKYVFELLGYNRRVPLYVLSKDSCSEVSRLLGQWFYKRIPNAKIYIAKKRDRKHSHDVLLLQGNKVYAIDPTVWQFFKNKKTILVATGNSIHGVLDILAHRYGGVWKLSEKIQLYSSIKIKKLKAIVDKNKSER